MIPRSPLGDPVVDAKAVPSLPPQGDIYMFGGRLETGLGNVTDELWVFSVASRTWQRRTLVLAPTAPGQQIYAVEGHSAHCVKMEGGEVVMVVLFGYSPIYSYVSSVQEYNIREC